MTPSNVQRRQFKKLVRAHIDMNRSEFKKEKDRTQAKCKAFDCFLVGKW